MTDERNVQVTLQGQSSELSAATVESLEPQAEFKKCLKALVDKKWSTLFQVRQNLQRMQDVWLPAAKNLTDTQKHQLNGDAYFLLIGITSAENVH